MWNKKVFHEMYIIKFNILKKIKLKLNKNKMLEEKKYIYTINNSKIKNYLICIWINSQLIYMQKNVKLFIKYSYENY